MRLLAPLRALLALALAASPAAAQLRLSVPEVVAPSFGYAPALAAPSFGAPLSLSAAVLPAPSLGLMPSLAPVVAPALGPAKLLSVPSAQSAPKDWTYDAVFDGAKPGVEGAAVTPALVTHLRPNLQLPIQGAVLRGAVERALPALRESVALGGWNGPYTTLDDRCCGDAAPKLAALLRAKGVPVRLVEAEMHYYLLVDLPEGQIVIDPTIRQFFGKKGAPNSVPTVFVGSIGELNALYERHARAKTTSYDPSRIYFRDAVDREAKLGALLRAIHAGGEAEYEPLRRELGLTPPPADGAAPRLIVLP